VELPLIVRPKEHFQAGFGGERPGWWRLGGQEEQADRVDLDWVPNSRAPVDSVQGGFYFRPSDLSLGAPVKEKATQRSWFRSTAIGEPLSPAEVCRRAHRRKIGKPLKSRRIRHEGCYKDCTWSREQKQEPSRSRGNPSACARWGSI
jgi:hypothetical protein